MEEVNNKEKNEFKICNPDEYELSFKKLAPNGRMYQTIVNKEKYKRGYINSKSYSEDDSFYAPYLLYKMGQKVGVEVPETELGIILHQNIDKDTFRDSFFESSIIYDETRGVALWENDGLSHVSPRVLQDIYLMENPGIAEKRRNEMYGRTMDQTIDDYVNSNLHYLTTRGTKSVQEYTKSEIDEMKQVLIDRALFGLKFGAHGMFDITLVDHKNARLDPYFLSNNMLSLNVRNEWIEQELDKSDEEFEKTMNNEYRSQYGLMPNIEVPSFQSAVKYIFEKYPKQAEKSYEKLNKFTSEDLENELNSYSRMSDAHKKFALRSFEIRSKRFEEIYQEHLKKQELSHQEHE